MDTKSLRKKTANDLGNIAEEKKDELIELRRKLFTEGIDDISSIRKLRKEIARVLTVKREIELEEKEKE